MSTHIRLLHVHSGNLWGGVEQMLQTMAPATAGIAPVASAFALCFEGRIASALREAHATVHVLGPVQARNPRQVIRVRRRLRDLLRRERIDLVMVHSSWAQAIFGAAVRSSGRPLIRWMHAPKPGPAWLELWAARTRPAMVVCNSHHTRDSVQHAWRGVPLEVHYPPAIRTASADGARAEVRRDFGTRPDIPVVLIAARLEPWKGHRVFLQGLTQLPGDGWEAWIAGGPQRPDEQRYLDELKRQAFELGLSNRVRFLGQRDDVSRLMRAADVYCQPNEGPEPFGLSVVEALGAGLPVVASRLGATPEIVTEDCGMLVGAGSVSALGEALKTLITDSSRRRAMSEAAERRATVFCNLPQSMTTLADRLARVLEHDRNQVPA